MARRSSARARRVWNSVPTSVPRERWSAPLSTLPMAVSNGFSFGVWKVRATPSRATGTVPRRVSRRVDPMEMVPASRA